MEAETTLAVCVKSLLWTHTQKQQYMEWNYGRSSYTCTEFLVLVGLLWQLLVIIVWREEWVNRCSRQQCIHYLGICNIFHFAESAQQYPFRLSMFISEEKLKQKTNVLSRHIDLSVIYEVLMCNIMYDRPLLQLYCTSVSFCLDEHHVVTLLNRNLAI